MRPLLMLLAVLALPLLEIGVFIAVGSEIGVGWTLLLVVLSTVLGVALVRRQSFATLKAAQAEAQAGRVPAREMAHGAMIVAAGFLLILPGFVTDAFGLLLLVPPVRDLLFRALASRVVVVETRRSSAYRRPAKPAVVDLTDEEFERREGDPESPWREIESRDAEWEDLDEDERRRRS